MEKNKIVITGETEFQDIELRGYMSKIETRVQTINERSKKQTLQIKELQNELKELRGERW